MSVFTVNPAPGGLRATVEDSARSPPPNNRWTGALGRAPWPVLMEAMPAAQPAAAIEKGGARVGDSVPEQLSSCGADHKHRRFRMGGDVVRTTPTAETAEAPLVAQNLAGVVVTVGIDFEGAQETDVHHAALTEHA